MIPFSFAQRAMVAFLVMVQMAAACPAFAETPVTVQELKYSLSSSWADADARAAPPRESDLLPPDAIPTFMSVSLQQSGLPDTLAGTYSLADPRQLLSESIVAKDDSAAEPTGRAAAAQGKGWRWRRASGAEYAGILIATGGALYIEKEYGKPAEANWKGHNGVDESVRNLLRLRSRSGRDTAHAVGDALMSLMIAAPVIDTFATLGVRDSRWDALWQTSVINLDSFAFTSFFSSLLQNVIKREKPFVRNCTASGCEDDEPNRSMPSGHVAFAFTGAGLLCNHHEYQSLYGDPTADQAVCTAGIVIAAADGIVRIMADRHYFTDVAAGTVLGLFSGFVLPRLLHYYRPIKPAKEDGKSEESLVQRITLNPQVLDGGAALNCDLRF
jgi:membrane-associated phospholipid phosphatase